MGGQTVLGNLPGNLYSICNFLFFVLLSVYAGCNGLASIYTRAAVVQGTYVSKRMVFGRVVQWWLGKNGK
jgi:hypothetical protein